MPETGAAIGTPACIRDIVEPQTDPIDDINSAYEGTLGGRILRDRLWFFVAGRSNESSQSRQTTLTNIPYVFGTEDKNQLKQGKTSIPVIDSEMNERVRAVVEKSRDHRGKGCGSITVPPLYLIREDGEPSLRLWAQTLLVEDRADQGVSGAQFVGMLREKVIS